MVANLSNIVAPTSGHTYQVQNLGFGHWLNDAAASTSDGSWIIGWSASNATNQIWTYLTYPSDAGDTVFALQTLSTTRNHSSFDGCGGYVHVNTESNKLKQGGAPMAWKLVEVSPETSIYKMVPFDDIISKIGSLIATDINCATDGTDLSTNQIALEADTTEAQQFWAFNLITA